MARPRKKSRGASQPDELSHSQAPRRSARLGGAAPAFSKDTLYSSTAGGKRGHTETQAVSEETAQKDGPSHSLSKEKAPPRTKRSKGKQKTQPSATLDTSQRTEVQEQGTGRTNQDDITAPQDVTLGLDVSKYSPGFQAILERTHITYFHPQASRPDSDEESMTSRSTTNNSSVNGTKTDNTAKPNRGPARIKSESDQFDDSMRARNVELKESKPRAEDTEIRTQIVPSNDVADTIEGGTRHIKDDWDPIMVTMRRKNEMHFTMTIFFNLINMYKDFLEPGNFDHATDRIWEKHEEPPSRDWMVPPTRPKPDIFIGFRVAAILTSSYFDSLGKEFRHMMVPEKPEAGDDGVAFPFLMMEAKGPAGKLGGSPVLRQVVNDASNALFNLWKFFKRAGKEAEFFKYIRVFTVAGSHERMTIRMHYALEEEDQNNWVTEGYPLRYRYEVLMTSSTDAKNCRPLIQNTLTNILKYAENKMLSLIKDSVVNVLNVVNEAKTGRWRSLPVSKPHVLSAKEL